MKKRIVFLALSSMAILALSFTINSKQMVEEETPRPTTIENSYI
ncbi:hypothetical protein PGC35_06680 [Psychrobacillus sp. PGGUH221]